MSESSEEKFMRRAIELAREGAAAGLGGPFGAVVVKDGQILAEGQNCVPSSNDPTAHAEVVAIRRACEKVGAFHLAGCTVYASCEPCPMCLSALYWAHVDAVYYAASREDAAGAGFDDEMLYRELATPIEARKLPLKRLLPKLGSDAFDVWNSKPDRVEY